MNYVANNSYAQPLHHEENQEVDWYYPETFLDKANDNITELQSLQKTRVLLIEDDRTTRRMVSKSIGDYCDITEAYNAGKGVAKFISFDPDIVFLDLELPDTNGQHILEWILWNDPGAYVVLFSGNCNRHNVNKAMNAGAKGYVPKPFDPAQMIYHICQCPKLHAA